MAADIYVHPQALNESDQVGDGSRIWAYAHVMSGAVVGRNCNIGDHAFIENGAVVGNGVTIKNGVCVWEGVTLEDYVFAGPNVVFTNDRFPRSPRNPIMEGVYEGKRWLSKTLIREGATVGANATILCGISIGRYAMVGAGSLVLRDVPDFELVAGSPAAAIGSVCMCGHRLPDDPSPVCTFCSRTYTLSDATLKLSQPGIA